MITRLIVFLTLLSALFANKCIIRRAALDIGSGSTKIVVADVDLCRNRIDKVLMESSQKVSYSESIEKSKTNMLSGSIQTKGLLSLMKLKSKARKFAPKQWFGVATAAFRKAPNAMKYLNKARHLTKIPIEIISQKEEAMIGLYAVKATSDRNIDDLVCWDIGGGSMQMITLDQDRKPVIYTGSLASVSFKNMIISKLLGQDPIVVNSPNPMSTATALTAVEIAQQQTDKIPEIIRNKLGKPQTRVYGIGGVHYYSIREQTGNKDHFTARMVREAINKRANATDDIIGGKYASTQISNLALVYGFMKGMNVYEVLPLKANLANGLLIFPDYWK
jgi:exopolyphosphatase/guanosine-5'-triphosphate,3'-diphosphate pyrophosphatase